MTEQNNNNPLSQYFRAYAAFVALPSGTSYYPTEVVEFNENGEVPLRPMTSVDELALKNPDALLSGDAVISMIKSCAPTIADPRQLLQNDMEMLILAIKKISYGDDYSILAECPKCNHENKYVMSIEALQNTAAHLDETYHVEIREGVKVYLKPFTYGSQLKSNKIAFEQMKVTKSMEFADEDTKIRMFNESFSEIAKLNFALITDSVTHVLVGEGEEQQAVTNKQHINEFLHNISVEEAKAIENLLGIINEVGVQKEHEVACEECKHEWKITTSYDPTSFFTQS